MSPLLQPTQGVQGAPCCPPSPALITEAGSQRTDFLDPGNVGRSCQECDLACLRPWRELLGGSARSEGESRGSRGASQGQPGVEQGLPPRDPEFQHPTRRLRFSESHVGGGLPGWGRWQPGPQPPPPPPPALPARSRRSRSRRRPPCAPPASAHGAGSAGTAGGAHGARTQLPTQPAHGRRGPLHRSGQPVETRRAAVLARRRTGKGASGVRVVHVSPMGPGQAPEPQASVSCSAQGASSPDLPWTVTARAKMTRAK